MLAGCSSTLLSPRHRLRSEASAQFQACHFPSMSTQRLDLPCSFARKDASRSQPIRPVGISVEKPLDPKTGSRSLKHKIRLPPSSTTDKRDVKAEFWEKGKSLKRFAEQGSFGEEDEPCTNSRAKRKKRGNGRSYDYPEDGVGVDVGEDLSLGQLGSGNFWFQPSFEVPRPVAPLITDLNISQLPFSLSFSGEEEEERVCFVPGDVISSPLPPALPPSNAAPWAEPAVTEIADLGDKKVETSHKPVKAVSGSSSTSSESHSLEHELNENNPPKTEIGNGSGLHNPPSKDAEVVGAVDHHHHHTEEEDFELISLIVACVEAIGSNNIAGINHFIAKLGDLASPRGSSPISRLASYFVEALAMRVTRLWPHIFHIATTPRELADDDNNSGNALRFLNQVSPIPKFIHFTSNEILLRAFEGKDRIHIIDFDIKQGLQWPGLFQSLASRTNPPSHVRITGIGESKQDLIETGNRLAGFAESLDLPFEFHPVVDRLEDVRLWMLHVKERETVAVNCVFQLHKMLYDINGGAIKDFLGLIRSTNPAIVLMAEQEAEHNDLDLEARVSNTLKYYSAIFDLVDSSQLPLDSCVRIKIEEMFGREIRNIIACEGSDRIERHESFRKWRKLMEEGGGFRSTGISERELLQSQFLLKMYSFGHYSVEKKQGEEDEEEEDGAAALMLSWLDQPLFTVSAWAPVDVAGSSSSYSQPS